MRIPDRWDLVRRTHEESLQELDRCAKILAEGTVALGRLYFRICDMLRERAFTDQEMREVLSKHFPPPRVSEFIRIANAPKEVYIRYYTGFIGFRAALAECRGYKVNSNEHLHRKKIRRAAERLIILMGQGTVSVCGKVVTIAEQLPRLKK